MFTDQEEQQLQEFYALAPNSETVISPEELNGLLFGLAITPEVLEPSEWFDDLYGDCPPAFPQPGSKEKIQGFLMEMIRRRRECNRSGKLSFPFDYEQMEEEDIDFLFDWSYGLFAALTLRPDIWKLHALESRVVTPLNESTDPDPDDLLKMSISIIAAAAFPEEIESMIVDDGAKKPKKGKKEIDDNPLSMVLTSLPFAVGVLQEYADSLSVRVS